MATPSATDLARLRRMAGETGGTYTDEVLSETLERYPLPDAAGLEDGADGYIPTFDFHAAAADVWAEKAGAAAALYDFSADGGDFARSQLAETAERQARYHNSRRKASSVPVESLYTSSTQEAL